MKFRAGVVGIIGYPNVGKSTILNNLLREEISIVSPKAQTTRRKIVGVVSKSDHQIIFYDSPGFVEEVRGLNTYLSSEAKEVIDLSDALLAVIGLDLKSSELALKTLKVAKETGKPTLVLLNKVDQEEHRVRILKAREMIKEMGFSDYFETSFVGKDSQAEEEQRKKILDTLTQMVPEASGPLYSTDVFTLETERSMVAEIIREQCLEKLKDEVPHQLGVRILKFDEESSKMPRIFGEILVSKENHKAIVVGHGGAMIKEIGSRSRKKIELLLGTKIFLDLKVVFKSNWFENPGIMRELGYDLPKSR